MSVSRDTRVYRDWNELTSAQVMEGAELEETSETQKPQRQEGGGQTSHVDSHLPAWTEGHSSARLPKASADEAPPLLKEAQTLNSHMKSFQFLKKKKESYPRWAKQNVSANHIWPGGHQVSTSHLGHSSRLSGSKPSDLLLACMCSQGGAGSQGWVLGSPLAASPHTLWNEVM